jgi:hypothetical protein
VKLQAFLILSLDVVFSFTLRPPSPRHQKARWAPQPPSMERTKILLLPGREVNPNHPTRSLSSTHWALPIPIPYLLFSLRFRITKPLPYTESSLGRVSGPSMEMSRYFLHPPVTVTFFHTISLSMLYNLSRFLSFHHYTHALRHSAPVFRAQRPDAFTAVTKRCCNGVISDVSENLAVSSFKAKCIAYIRHNSIVVVVVVVKVKGTVVPLLN